MRWQ
jgi:predicted phage-related endonuclease